jgi:hypothetical protein
MRPGYLRWRERLVALGSLAFVVVYSADANVSRQMDTTSAQVHRLAYDPSDPRSPGSLPLAVVVAAGPFADQESLVEQFKSAHTNGTATVSNGSALFILSAGPVLDSPDRVAVRRLSQRGNWFDLEVDYSSARLEESPLRRNVQWRPLVQIPLSEELSPGKYRVKAHWVAVGSTAAHEPPPGSRLSEAFAFEVQ